MCGAFRDGFEVAARRAPGIRNRDPEHRIVARVRRLGAGGAGHERLEVSVAGVHRSDAERCKQERQREAHVIGVIERTQEHRKEHQPESRAESGWKDVDAAAPERHGATIRSLAPADPVARETIHAGANAHVDAGS